MTIAYAYTPAIWPPLGATILLAVIGLYGWRRRDVFGAKWLVASTAIGALWMLGFVLEAAAMAPAATLAWYRFQTACRLPALTASTCFVLECAYPGRWLSRSKLAALWLPSLLYFLAILIAPQLFWTSMQVSPDGLVRLHRSAAALIPYACGLGMLLVMAAALIWLFIRSPLHRWPVTLFLAGETAAFALVFLDRTHLVGHSFVNLSVAGLVVGASVQALALFAFRILDPVPATRQAVIAQMHDGVVVFDARGRVVGLNPAAEKSLGASENAARGKTWQEVAPPTAVLPDLLQGSAEPASQPARVREISLGSGADVRHYTLALSELRDFRGLLLGRLLMMRDFTEQRRAQAQILEQRQSLAVLQERERLGRELHDSIGQVLGYAGFQVEVACQLIEDGQGADAQAQLARLAGVLRDAHADVRQQILDLRVTPDPQEPFPAVVQRYLEGFTGNYGIRARLTWAEALSADAFSPEAQVQLLRILQEALANVRKHSGARRVEVAFAEADDRLRMSIEDDGCGFTSDPAMDPIAAGEVVGGGAAGPGGHFGLRFMAERAQQLGGSLQTGSTSGRGARIAVEIPRKEG